MNSRGGVNLKIADQEARVLALVTAPAQRLDAREEFFQREGFDQVIVRALLQPVDAILDGVLGGEDEDVSGFVFGP